MHIENRAAFQIWRIKTAILETNLETKVKYLKIHHIIGQEISSK